MIPPTIDPADTPSVGERLIFNLLRNAPDTDSWFVFHSQRIARVHGKPEGEADFVICIPDLGVLVLEVKSHAEIHRDHQGQWLYGKAQKLGKDPFKQAGDAMYSLMDLLRTSAPETAKEVFFANAVVFTHTDASPVSGEWRPAQIINSNAMSQVGIVEAIVSSLKSSRQHLRDSIGVVPKSSSGSTLSTEHMDRLRDILRPRVDLVMKPSSAWDLAQAELIRLTEEQYRALDEMVNNELVVFEGPAGTGKTLLAVEAARRAVADGQKVLLLCHNQALARHLASALGDIAGPSIVVGTAHEFFLKVTGLSHDDADGDLQQFYSNVLPLAVLDALTSPTPDNQANRHLTQFDTIIIDELQDLSTSEFLEIIPNLLSRQKEATARIFAFGDIENQAFFEKRSAKEIRSLIKSHWGPVSFRTLTVNCRNNQEHVDLLTSLLTVRPPYSKVRDQQDMFKPQIVTFSNDQTLDLVELLDKLDEKGYLKIGTTVLSLSAEEESAAAQVKEPRWRDRLRPHWKQQSKRSIPYTSVYRFKGLESPVVVLTDISVADLTERHESLYVGITRATALAFLLVNRECHELIKQKRALWMLQGFTGDENE